MKVEITKPVRVREGGKKIRLEVGDEYAGDMAQELVNRGRAVEIGKSTPAEKRETKVVEAKETKKPAKKPAAKKKTTAKKTAKKSTAKK